MATGEPADGIAGGTRQHPGPRGTIGRQQDGAHAPATGCDTSGFACDEAKDGTEGASIECEAEGRKENGHRSQIEENGRCKVALIEARRVVDGGARGRAVDGSPAWFL